MSLTRREFLTLTATVCAGCTAGAARANAAAPRGERTIDAGPASYYAADGVYDLFRNEGFFVVRKGGQLVVFSSYCTHKKCKLNAEPDRSFSCDCHGSTFDPSGKVTQGPAKRDMPLLSCYTDQKGHLIVTVAG